MAMTKRLWSISALAVEFNLDRRTVARRINHIPHSSGIGEAKQWNLADVASALAPGRPEQSDGNCPIVDSIMDRLEGWEEVHAKPAAEVSISDFALMTGDDPLVLLLRLRAGMPYVVEGNWITGEGFTIRTADCINWSVFAAVFIRRAGRMDIARELGL